jgi:chromosomal replication initiator protein
MTILQQVTQLTGITETQMLSDSRVPEIVSARHIAMYCLRKSTNMRLEMIGEVFNRDHSTVINAVTKVESDMAVDPNVRKIVKKILDPLLVPNTH